MFRFFIETSLVISERSKEETNNRVSALADRKNNQLLSFLKNFLINLFTHFCWFHHRGTGTEIAQLEIPSC